MESLPKKDLLFVSDKDPFLLSNQKPEIGKMEKSSVLSSVLGFLPTLQKSNEELEAKLKECPEALDIEHIEDEESPHIQLSLAVGVNDTEEENIHETLITEESKQKATLIEELPQ